MQTSNVVTLIIDGKNKAVTAIKDAVGNLTELEGVSKKTGLSIDSVFGSVKSIAAIAGIGLTAGALFSFGKDAIIASAQLGVLRDNFKGTTQDIELFQKATAGTVTEANLIKLSNQASDLGLTMKEQAILFSLAEDAADKYGGGVEENFQKVLRASEGGTKGLKDLGIQKAVYDEIVKSYLNDYGVKNLNQLDAEAQKWIQVEAMIKATSVTLDDVAKKLPDAADKIEAIGVNWEEFKTRSGDVLLPILGTIVGTIISLDDWAIKAGNDLDHLIGLKGILGNGDQSKPPDNTQNQVDLMNALNYRTYVDENGKFVREEIKKVGQLSAAEIEAQSKKVQDALDITEKKAEEIKKASDLITFENSLIGLSDVDRKLMELLKQAEEWKAKGVDISLVDETTLLRSDELIRQALAAKLRAREESDTKEQAMRDKEYDDEVDHVNRMIQLYIDAEDKKYWLKEKERRKEEELEQLRIQTVISAFGDMANSEMIYYELSGSESEAAFNRYKAFAIAETLINTYYSAAAAYKAMVGIPVVGPFLAVAAASAATLYGMAQISRITSVGPSGGGSAGSSGDPPGTKYPSDKITDNSSTTTNNNNARHVTINIHSIGGFGSSADKLIRDELAPAIRKAIRDGIIDFGGN